MDRREFIIRCGEIAKGITVGVSSLELLATYTQSNLIEPVPKYIPESMLEDLEELGWEISDITTLPIILQKPERDTRMTANVVVNLGYIDNDGVNYYTISYQLNTPDGVYEDSTMYCKGVIETKQRLEAIVFGHLEAYLSRGITATKEARELHNKYKIK